MLEWKKIRKFWTISLILFYWVFWFLCRERLHCPVKLVEEKDSIYANYAEEMLSFSGRHCLILLPWTPACALLVRETGYTLTPFHLPRPKLMAFAFFFIYLVDSLFMSILIQILMWIMKVMLNPNYICVCLVCWEKVKKG